MLSELYIGLMSGTSADAIDAVLVDFRVDPPHLLATHTIPFDRSTRAAIQQLARPGTNEIDRMGPLDQLLGGSFAQAALELLEKAGIVAADVAGIGSHGQTLRHRPPGRLSAPFSLQVGDPNVIAQNTGIKTVADFRRRDIAAGGQGAPLVPAFHQARFHSIEANRAIVNIGGIANLTWLPAQGAVVGFDSGPGNGLMDAWINRFQGKAYDHQGQWAASGEVNTELLDRLLAHPYFSMPAPKSTGPEEFHLDWLDQELSRLGGDAHKELKSEDVQATLLSLTAQSIADSVTSLAENDIVEIYICGGGAHNQQLTKTLAALLPKCPVNSTAALGLAPDWIEAVAFAWLARQTLKDLPGNLPSVTGARQACILGAIYPA